MMNDKIELIVYQLLLKYKSDKVFDFSISPLFGDASGREYFRVRFGEGSCIAAVVASGGTPEFGRGDPYFDFISIQAELKKMGIRVPEIYAVKDDSRSLLVEDLGDNTMFNSVQTDPGSKFRMIKFGVNLLSMWQEGVYKRKNFKTVVDKRSFNKNLFMNEFYHFYEYMIEKRVYHRSFEGLWDKIEKPFVEIVKELTDSPYIFSHRDFQSKNIMICNGEGYLIDFQDAILAPAVYDLVSLVRDSYIVLSDEELDSILNLFWKISPVIREVYRDFEHFYRLFHLQTVQRKLKDAGRFIFLNQIKGKKWFLPYVQPSLRYVRSSLLKLGMEDLLEILGPYVSELELRSSLK
jgi:N-acetylmuramate 1-kinase